MANTGPRVGISISLPLPVANALADYARGRGEKISSIVTGLIEREVEQNGSNPQNTPGGEAGRGKQNNNC